MAYKMICLDLDGTLLNKQSELNLSDIETLRKCLEKGIYVYLVSGRPYFFARYIADLISKDVHVISSSGGCYEIDGNIVERSFDKATLDKVIDILAQDEMHAFYKGKDSIYTMDEADPRFTYDRYFGLENFPEIHVYKALSIDELKAKASKVDKILVYNMDEKTLISSREKTKAIEDVVVTSYNNISFDVNSKGTTKGAMIKVVADALKIDTKDIIAYGDGENDVPMFEVCGYRVAMENAKEHIKSMADEVTLDYLHAGVSHSLKQIFDLKD